MYKYYVNWKYIRQLKSLIAHAIKYVEGDKMQVKLMNKLAGIPEEPKPIMPFYFKAVYDAVNEYNRHSSRIHYHFRPLTIQQDFFEEPGYGHTYYACVTIVASNGRIAEHRRVHYDYIDRHKALEQSFEQVFNMITTHGLATLVEMYNHGVNHRTESRMRNAIVEHQANLLKGRNALAATNGWHDDRDDFKQFLSQPMLTVPERE